MLQKHQTRIIQPFQIVVKGMKLYNTMLVTRQTRQTLQTFSLMGCHDIEL